MRALAGSVRRAAKVSLFLSAVVLASLAVAQDSRPASAADTEVFFTLSRSSPSPPMNVILFRGDPNPITVYVWARKVVDPNGLAGYEVDLTYDSSLMSVNSIVGDTSWLDDTGRWPTCSTPVLEPGHANVSCNTLAAPPPFGPQGDGPLATLTLKGGSQLAVTTLTLTSGTVLVNTGGIPKDNNGDTEVDNPPAVIPSTLRSVQITIANCADFDGDGSVTLFGDIFAVAFAFGRSGADPNWNSTYKVYDLNKDGNIDLFNDIFGTALQFGMSCKRPG